MINTVRRNSGAKARG